MTTGEFVAEAAKIVTCRTHDALSCETCVESTAQLMGLRAWNLEIASVEGLEEALEEIMMEKEG